MRSAHRKLVFTRWPKIPESFATVSVVGRTARVDLDRTRTRVAKRGVGHYRVCRCGWCRNFVAQEEDVWTTARRAAFEAIGLDPTRPFDLTASRPVDDRYEYIGLYNDAIGSIGEDFSTPIGDHFILSISDDHSRKEPFQLVVFTAIELPWVLPEPPEF